MTLIISTVVLEETVLCAVTLLYELTELCILVILAKTLKFQENVDARHREILFC